MKPTHCFDCQREHLPMRHPDPAAERCERCGHIVDGGTAVMAPGHERFAYACGGCQLYMMNCVCLPAPHARIPRYLWHVWNYGLFGDEHAADVPGVRFFPGVRYIIEVPTYPQLYELCLTQGALNIALHEPPYTYRIMGSIQLPTSYSTCGYDNETPHWHLRQNTALWCAVERIYA